jgi:uncharacterized membrane protein YbhN (UPF0104 family)
MSKQRTRILSIAITILVVGALFLYLYNNRHIFAQLVEIQRIFLLYLALLWILTITIPGIRFKVFLNSFGINLSFNEWFGISIITHMTSMIMPFQTGKLPSAVYLKTRYNFTFAHFTSILAGSYILFFLATSCLGLIVSGIFYLSNSTLDIRFPLFFLIVFSVSSAFIIIAPKIPTQEKGIVGFFGRVIAGWYQIKSDIKLVFTVFFIFALGSLVTAFTFFIGYKALSLEVDYLPIILISLVTQYSIFIKFTPGNIGIREAVFAFASELAGIGFNEGLLAGLLFRAVDLVLVVCIGPIFSYILSRNLLQFRKANRTM